MVAALLAGILLPLAAADTGRVPDTTGVASAAVSGTVNPAPDTAAEPALTLAEAERRVRARADTDTVAPVRRRRAPVVEYSDAYGQRVRWHRWASYSLVPLFATQYYLGNRLLDDQRGPAWVRNGHTAVAVATAGVFTFNTATGLWNLWEGRRDPSGRVKKWLHAASFLVADAGFIYGARLADRAKTEGQATRLRHRNVSLAAMGISLASWGAMLLLDD